MSLEFYKTQAGRRFYDGVMPRIADALERIANHLEAEKAEEKRSVLQEVCPNMTELVNEALQEVHTMASAEADRARNDHIENSS